jgi:NAD(P)-dependent dehydrogenase (short-subunit alcohol dehydrogenase family)
MNKKVILVTGANKGIGFEIVRQLALQGHNVILTARDSAKGEQAVNNLSKEGLTVHFIKLDVTNEQQIIEAVEKTKNLFGHLDVLINNAGIMRQEDKSILQTNDAAVKATLETNALAPLKVSQAFTPLIPKGGRIIMMSSNGGSMTEPIGGWSPVYCVSKSMLNSLTRHLAFALAENGIGVSAMCPGWVKTDLGGSAAPRNVQQGADTAVWLATSDVVPTGKIWQDRKEILW